MSADSELAVDHRLRCRAAALLLPDRAAFVSWSAAALHGVGGVDPGLPVAVHVPHGRAWGPLRGVSVTRSALPAAERTTADGVAVATPERVLFDLAARRLAASEAVVLVDAVLARWPVLERRLDELTAWWVGRRGIDRVRVVLSLADGRSESPMESRLRVLLALGGLPRPVPQHVVRDAAGRFVARVDLAWPDERVAVEYDGLWHADSDQFHRDRRRLNALGRAGWVVVHVTRPGLADGAAGVAADVRRQLSARSAGLS